MIPGRAGQCCPICSQSFMGTSLKYHIKTCARVALAQLTDCSCCGRPVRRDDLKEHLEHVWMRVSANGLCFVLTHGTLYRSSGRAWKNQKKKKKKDGKAPV
eukprot:TRINITY_DN113914_c0_g1_i1.p1 TRINITY_DN113914_c0_g1~~TRINITY_DN113914_c0_g1_i1.p1  ORF type:complete len:101 (+),score=10.84 TRINITY_DN113914_c0_g1_i1:45-347(+)